jgi:hypothetical protein
MSHHFTQVAGQIGSQLLPHLTGSGSAKSSPKAKPPANESRANLRILPLGASVVRGEGSSNGNGYRKELSSAVNKTGDRTTAASFTSSNPSGFSARSSDSGFSGQLIESTNPSQSGTSKSDDKNLDPLPRGIPAMAEPTKLTYVSAQTKA